MPLNFEEMFDRCRLCQLHPGTLQIVDNIEFIGQVYECTKININNEHMHLLPKTVCSSCKLSIEEFFVYLQDIRLVDQKLHQRILKCERLKTEYSNNIKEKDLLQKEIKTDTAGNNRFKCPVCTKTYARLKNLELHKRNHVSLHCSKCEMTFADTAVSKRHKCCTLNSRMAYPIEVTEISKQKNSNIEDIKEDKVTKEEWFEDEFSGNNKDIKVENHISNGEVDVHDFSQKGEPEVEVNPENISRENYVCEICNENFVCNADLRAHQKNHTVSFPCTFENCNKICTSAYTLRTHLMRHEGKMPFLCVTCGKGFTTKNSLNCHEKTHAKIKGYACKECNIGFSVASNLRAHQKKHHEGVRFYCSQCTRAFITKCSLERHELVHTGIKEFKCASCQAAFYTNKELLKHQRYHQGLRLYKCDQCFKTFFEKHHLTIHIRVHTGERPYACKAAGCGKSFTESQKLSRHMKARHPPV